MGVSAFVELAKKKSKKDPRAGGVTSHDESSAGEEYSKVGDVTGDDDYDNDEAGEDGRLYDASDDGGGDAGDDAMERQAAFESFADAAGISPERRKRAHAALHQFMKSCNRGSSKTEE